VIARTGKPTTLSVRQVASQDEIALLRTELAAPPPVRPAPEDIENMRKDLVSRIEGPLMQAWPAGVASLVSYELGFTPEGTVARIRYTSRTPLDGATEEVLTRVLKAELKTDKLRLVLEREPLPRARRPK
jgi:hypothetical protein